MLPRLHLFEFLDQPWFPSAARDHMTDYLQVVSERMHLFDGAAEVLARGLASSPESQVVDLGSGGSGPLPALKAAVETRLGRPVHWVLTDLFPHSRARERALRGGAEYLETPVDARSVPPALRGMRTLFNALHHLRPHEVREVLADAQKNGVPFAAFEVVQRNAQGIIAALMIPLLVLLMTPLLRPLTFLRLFLTYVLPLAPVAIFWDGLVSSLRAHSPEELRALTQDLSTARYRWEVGEVRLKGRPAVCYLLGIPTRPR